MENHNIYMSLLPMQLREQYRCEWRIIHLGSIGIPVGWVQHWDMGLEIRIELPRNWYQDDHFLRFGFFCVHQSESYVNFILDLVIDEQCSFLDTVCLPYCEYHGEHGSKSNEEFLLYYPKIAILDKYHSN